MGVVARRPSRHADPSRRPSTRMSCLGIVRVIILLLVGSNNLAFGSAPICRLCVYLRLRKPDRCHVRKPKPGLRNADRPAARLPNRGQAAFQAAPRESRVAQHTVVRFAAHVCHAPALTRRTSEDRWRTARALQYHADLGHLLSRSPRYARTGRRQA